MNIYCDDSVYTYLVSILRTRVNHSHIVLNTEYVLTSQDAAAAHAVHRATAEDGSTADGAAVAGSHHQEVEPGRDAAGGKSDICLTSPSHLPHISLEGMRLVVSNDFLLVGSFGWVLTF